MDAAKTFPQPADSMTDASAQDLRAFETFTRGDCRRRFERTALVCAGLLAFAWIVGRIALEGAALEAPGRFWLAVLTLVSGVAWLVFRYLPLAARFPLWFGAATHATLAVGGALHVGQMSDLDGPFFYVVYTLPPLSIGMPCKLSSRIPLSMAGAGAFVVTYFGTHPEYLDHPMLHVPIVVLTCVTMVAWLLGHQLTAIVRDRFLFARQLERQQRQLAAHAEWLEREVEERTHALGALSRALASASAERHDVARDLHDDLGQLIVGARMELSLVERTLAHRSGDHTKDLAYLTSVVEMLDGSVRRFIERLREPPTSVPLAESLASLIAPLSVHGVEVESKIRVAEHLPEAMHKAVFRHVQEAVTNALKHSGARRLLIRVDADVNGVIAEVSDDGRGFEPSRVREGWGLIGLRERACALGGEVEIESRRGRTAVRLIVAAPKLSEAV